MEERERESVAGRVGEKDGRTTRRRAEEESESEEGEQRPGPMLLRSEEARRDSPTTESAKTEGKREGKGRNEKKGRERRRRRLFKRRAARRGGELREMELGAPQGHILFPFEAPDKSNAAECIIR